MTSRWGQNCRNDWKIYKLVIEEQDWKCTDEETGISTERVHNICILASRSSLSRLPLHSWYKTMDWSDELTPKKVKTFFFRLRLSLLFFGQKGNIFVGEKRINSGEFFEFFIWVDSMWYPTSSNFLKTQNYWTSTFNVTSNVSEEKK